MRADADRYDGAVRSDARAEAERVLADARRRAEDVVDAAEREAAALREESAAAWEDARARSAQAATDFELALATRRHRTEVEAQELHRSRTEELGARGAARGTGARPGRRRRRGGRRPREEVLSNARREADELVVHARDRAAAVRAESDRELAAATERRDSINAQLANVRQMLSTLAGGSSAPAGSVPVTAWRTTAPATSTSTRRPGSASAARSRPEGRRRPPGPPLGGPGGRGAQDSACTRRG